MHEDELEVDVPLVRRLLEAQFPEWAELELDRVLPAGTDNAIFRLGDDMAVRLPRIRWAAGQPDKEFEWAPRLAPSLPLEVPVPLAKGVPGEEYPWEWTVCRWLHGDTALAHPVADAHQLASDLAGFVVALQRIDPTGAPPARRGRPLATVDDSTRASLAALAAELDGRALTVAWEKALAASAWDGAPVWTHGDLDPRNLVVREGRLTGVLDVGGVGIGDPACDVAAAWKVLPAPAREGFRAALDVDDATWERARGWVVSQSVNALAYYTLENNAALVRECRRWLAEVLASG
jgi:aminoglycoside phosphotransferase (APT) family kinase protein